LRIALGDHAQAQRDLETSLALSQRLGDDFGIVGAQIGLARLSVVQARFEDAAAHIQEVLSMPNAAGEDQNAQALWLWGLVQAERGDLEIGLTSATQALEMSRAAGLIVVEARCLRALGILHARAGDHLEAELSLRESIDLCIQVNAPYDQGLALLELGRMYLDVARMVSDAPAEWHAKALVVLHEAIDSFERLGAAHDLRTARTLLSQVPSNKVVAE
jgi:tetratricopeptide (TPR) repeat protein